LAELLYCSTSYTKDSPHFETNQRHLFRGDSCYPLSPRDNFISKDDQLINIWEKVNYDESIDLSHLSDDDQFSYMEDIKKAVRKN